MSKTKPISFQGAPSDLIWKLEGELIQSEIQLLVNPGQVAFIKNNGGITDELPQGLHWVKGLDSGFSEIWFLNYSSSFDFAWGTERPIQVEDTKYGIIVPIRAFGECKVTVKNTRKFFETVTSMRGKRGNPVVAALQLREMFNPSIARTVSLNISKKITTEAQGVLQLHSQIDRMSQSCEEDLTQEFDRFGLSVVKLNIESINIPEDDQGYLRLRELKQKQAEVNILGRDIYEFEKNCEILAEAIEKGVLPNEGILNSIMTRGLVTMRSGDPRGRAGLSEVSKSIESLQQDVAKSNTSFDRRLLDVLLRELHHTSANDCRHAGIALCGKLLELALSSLVSRWGRSVEPKWTLNDIICVIQGCASPQAPDTPKRREAIDILSLGLSGIADLIRVVRNGAVHVRFYSENSRPIELPSSEQTNAVILLTLDLIKRFILTNH